MKLNLFAFADEDFGASKYNHSQGFESFRGGFVANPVKNLFLYGAFLLDEHKAKDKFYTGKKWRGLAGGVEESFVFYQSKFFDVKAGRFASFWGERNSLVLSARNNLDGFEYSFHWGKLVLSYRLAKLDGLNPDKDTVSVFENRYFAGHRLDIHLSKKLRFGVFETMIFGGPGRTVELYYLNPLLFFHSNQLNKNINDNSFFGFDFTLKPRKGWKLYSQLLIDDFQIDKKTQGDQEPNEYGLMVGSYWVNLLQGFDAKLEYSRVTNRTYNQDLPRNRYLNDNQLLSDALGNDYDRWVIKVSHWFNENFEVAGNFTYKRQGEGRVTTDWDTPWFDIEGDYHEPFPTGIVEKTAEPSVAFRGFVYRYFFISCEGGMKIINNFNNITDDDRNIPFFNLKISTFFSVPLRVE